MASSSPVPAQLGYRMPAEWERHQATWLTWPRSDGISFVEDYRPIPAVWAEMAAALSHGEEVHINIFSEAVEKEAKAALQKAGVKLDEKVFLHSFPAYEPWCRDHGPIFIRSQDSLAVVDWGYNAWGGKYAPWDLDDAVPQRIAELLGVPLFQPGIIMEGGSLEVDGEGTLMTTEACLLNPNRNPELTRAQIEQKLCDYLGVTKVLWLDEGIVCDDTDGHIDDMTRFVAPGTVITAIEEDPADDNYEALQENRRRLTKMTTAKGKPLEIIDLPMPGYVEMHGQRVPASYANFYIGNEVVLLPVFEKPNDEKARAILQRIFPTRKVLPLRALDLVVGQGTYHCVTQQQPAFPA